MAISRPQRSPKATLRTSSFPRQAHRNPWVQGWQRVLALLALANLGWVVFDLTYISMRDSYLRWTPLLTQSYDRMKGIEPHRETQTYLDSVDLLQRQLERTGPQNPTVLQSLATLRHHSEAMIEANPFENANKSGTLERIKNKMRRKLPNPENSSKQAFRSFWSPDHLTPSTWRSEMAFFDREIRPLITTNYWRPIAENNQPVDHFWRFDLYFIALFSLDVLVRTLLLSHRRPGMNWWDAMLWRWYDLLLLLPFWRLLRVLPVTLRLHQSGWVDLSRIQVQVKRFVAENIVGEVTELAIVRTVNVAQTSLDQGVLAQWLQTDYDAVEINEVNEIAELSSQVLAMTINRVLPKIQPDLELLLKHAISEALESLPFYQQVQQLPGVSQLSAEVASQLISRLNRMASVALNQIRADQQGQAITQQLTTHFTEALRTELQDPETLETIQTLLSDFLEEMKLTIVRHLETDNIEQTAQEVSRLRQGTQPTPLPTVTVIDSTLPVPSRGKSRS